MVESDLHLKLKKAVETHLAEGSHCWFESTMGPWGGSGSLRVDVQYTRNRRYYYFECETKPNISRLIHKGEKRKKCYYRTVYNLVIPTSEFNKNDWSLLRGYFDNVYGYDEQLDEIPDRVDLRTLGSLQDIILNRTMPFLRSPEFREFCRFFWKRKNLCRHCYNCLRGRSCPWPQCWDEPCILYKRLWGDPDDFWKWSRVP